MKHFMTPIPKAMCTGTPTCDTKNTDISSHSPDDSKAWICPKIIQNIFQMIAPYILPTQNLFKIIQFVNLFKIYFWFSHPIYIPLKIDLELN